MKNIDRRTFIKMAALVAATPAFSSGCSAFSQQGIKALDNKEGFFTLRNVTLISMVKGDRPLLTDISVKGNRIISITPAGEAMSIPGKSIDATGKYVIPALIDSHCHVSSPFHIYLDKLFIAAGVTSVRDMATPRFQWEDRGPGGIFEEKTPAGPRVFTVAGHFDGSPPVFSVSYIPKNKLEVERYLDELTEYKITSLKIYSHMSEDILRHITQGASHRGIYVVGHVPLGLNALTASEIGMNQFEHNIGIADTFVNVKDKHFVSYLVKSGKYWLEMEDRKQDLDSLAREMKRRDIVHVPTFNVYRGLAYGSLPKLRNDPRLAYMPGFFPDYLWTTKWMPNHDRWTTEMTESIGKGMSVSGYYTKMLKENGATVLAGTDCPLGFSIPGFSIHDELRCFVEFADFTPEEALASATREAAKVLGADNKIGTIEEGKIADMVVLNNNPLANIEAVSEINSVVYNGSVLTREEIDRELAQLSEKYRGFLYKKLLNPIISTTTSLALRYVVTNPKKK